MNLAFLSAPTSAQLQQDMLSKLKQQNHRLAEVMYNNSIIHNYVKNIINQLFYFYNNGLCNKKQWFNYFIFLYKPKQEVSKKSQRIALLEQEKDNLVRELYNRQSSLVQSRRATMIHEQHDQTFM